MGWPVSRSTTRPETPIVATRPHAGRTASAATAIAGPSRAFLPQRATKSIISRLFIQAVLLYGHVVMPVAPLRIAVIGAGLGGLTAAAALHRAGLDVRVYEQAPELTEVGGGINMGPNAARVVYRLGLGDGLDREAVRPASTHQRRWQDGRTLQRAPLNPRCEELYGAPHLTVHRADLLATIASGFAAERVHLGHRLVGLDDGGDRVAAWFENGARITADILIGADGINSTVRAVLLGEEAPRFAGCVAYRGLVPAERIADLDLELGSQSWVGPGGHFGHYFLPRGPLLNFVGGTAHETR